jgi:predicted amidophosphoribosyltransferase
MGARPICQRCHRTRPVSGRYCDTCASDLRRNETRRYSPEQADAIVAAALANKAASAPAALPEGEKAGARGRG